MFESAFFFHENECKGLLQGSHIKWLRTHCNMTSTAHCIDAVIFVTFGLVIIHVEGILSFLSKNNNLTLILK
jgi:hypothetical protein